MNFVHRDLSWVQFNERVLAEAAHLDTPLLERLKFLSISASNMDEFYMVRVSSLLRGLSLAERNQNEEELLRLKSAFRELNQELDLFLSRQNEIFWALSFELEKLNIFFDFQLEKNLELQALAKQVFETEIKPQLPEWENFSLSKLSQVQSLQHIVIQDEKLWLRVPKSLSTTFVVQDEKKNIYIFFLDQLLSFFLGGKIYQYRLTRDADFSTTLSTEDSASIPDLVRAGISTRDRGRPVRVQYLRESREFLFAKLREFYKLDEFLFQESPVSFYFHGLWNAMKQIAKLLPDSQNYLFATFTQPSRFEGKKPSEVFQLLDQTDVLLHHPYDSFESYVDFLKAACADPRVVSIEQTVYRMDNLSPIMKELTQAAKKKKVRVFIELRARFDESHNLEVAEILKKSGAEVYFGFGKLKLHAKVALITRREGDGFKHYTHLSTGNYNAATSRAYTDLALLTSRSEVGADARKFFDAVAHQQMPSNFQTLVIAPTRLHRKIMSLIESETAAALAGKPARIFAKVNALVDKDVITKLYTASQAGVKIELLVRGACSLLPQVQGLSENIRVFSIVDKFLEHSRIYYFEHSNVMYLSSADWMPRNFFNRLEIAFPALDNEIFKYLRDLVLPTYIHDNVKAWELQPSGRWIRKTPRPNEPKLRAQVFFEALAAQGIRHES